MKTKLLHEEQIKRFKHMINGAVTVLAPNSKPGDPIVFSRDQLRNIVGVLGEEGTGREVEAYILMEQEKWKDEPTRKAFLDDLLKVTERELELLEFFDESKAIQTEYPLPAEVAVLNLDTGKTDRMMPMGEFLENLRAVKHSSVFKR